MTLTQSRRRTPPPASYGSVTFAARLSAREAALGLVGSTSNAPVVQDVTQVDNDNMDTVAGSRATEPGDARPLPGSRHDRWGNIIISGDAEHGPHTIRSLWDGRMIRVCGEYRTGRHNAWWTFDEETMRPVCSVCFGWQKGA